MNLNKKNKSTFKKKKDGFSTDIGAFRLENE